MSAITLTNAVVVDLDPPGARVGSVLVEDGVIAAVGEGVPGGGEVVDCGGAVVLPGLVNGHTHLYSALACGMPPPAEAPTNFREILERVWWKLDLALDERGITTSARIGAVDALRCGTTTLIDHHASPSAIEGSLDMIEDALEGVGLRGVLCYEVTDRNGRDGREAGLQETHRYLEKCGRRSEGKFAGLVGGHALFTLEDDTLSALADLAQSFDSGVHLHLAEDACDEEACNADHQMFLMDRLKSHRLLQRASLFAHGVHVSDEDLVLFGRAGCTFAHNARSNMNNSVGYARVAQMMRLLPVVLGTDGIGSDMLAEAKAAFFKASDEGLGLSPAEVLKLLANSAARAAQALEVDLGKIEKGYVADLVVTDYVPHTPLTSDNVAGHVLFGLDSRHVKDVMTAGQWRLRDRQVLGVDEPAERRAAQEVARDLWQRMQA